MGVEKPIQIAEVRACARRLPEVIADVKVAMWGREGRGVGRLPYGVILLAWIAGLEALAIPSAEGYFDEVAPSLESFSAYKPTYFLLGSPDAKGQLSIKIQPIESVPLFFGYSQLMMWDLFKSSAPMRDINYDPEVFFRISLGDHNARRWLDISPIEHESNGKSGPDSRSWNRAYLRYSDTLFLDRNGPDAAREKLHWSVRLWLPYADENGDLQRYRGLGELTVTLSNFLGPYWKRGDVSLRLYPGGASFINPLRGGQELTLRLKLQKPHILPLLVFQVFHGYGEDLLDYRQDRLGLRAGIGF